jgi:hypothetical protein
MRDIYRDYRDAHYHTPMRNSDVTPARRFLDRFGVQRLAKWSGRDRRRVHAWAWPEDKGGTGGVIPHKVRQLIIDGVRDEVGEVLTFADFEPREGEAYLFKGAGA